MSQSQQRTHKWKPSIKMRVLHLMKDRVVSPSQMSKKIHETQAATSVAMYELWQKNQVKRMACMCGRGFVYWK